MPRDDYTTNVEAAAHEAREIEAQFQDNLDELQADMEAELRAEARLDTQRAQHHYQVPVTREDFAPRNPHIYDEEPPF